MVVINVHGNGQRVDKTLILEELYREIHSLEKIKVSNDNDKN